MRPWVSLADRESSRECGKVLLPARLSPDFNICSRNFTDGAGRALFSSPSIFGRNGGGMVGRVEPTRKRSRNDGSDYSPPARDHGTRTGARHWGTPPLFP